MKRLLLLCVLVLGLFVRTYNVSINPPSLSWDEVSIGYNAYSILKIGKDEHGRSYPLDSFISYGDYKPPLAIYSAVPFVFLFGLTDFAVRLPAAIFGTLSLVLTYLLVMELFLVTSSKKKTDSQQDYDSSIIALLSTAVLAISPWHVNISRGGFEANVALFFVLLGAWSIVLARRKTQLLLIMWLPFVAAIYTFNSARYFVPILSLALIWYSYENIKKNIKSFSIGIFIAIVCMLPIIPHLASKESRLRFKEVNIFTDSSIVEKSNARNDRALSDIESKLVNNRRVGYTRSYLMHFFDNLQPDFLFIKGDGNPKFSTQDTGQLYLIEAPLLAIGFFRMFTSYPMQAAILLYWLLMAIVPAATARETPHALRILNSLPTWHIFIAFGIYSLYNLLRSDTIRKHKSNVFMVCLVFLYILQFGYYLHGYYAHYPKEFSGEWQYGYRQAIQKITPIKHNYDSVVLTDSIGRPYMYTAFYIKAHPDDFLRTKSSYTDNVGFYHVDGFSNYTFLDVIPDSLNPKTLYVWDASEVPIGVRVIDTIKLLDGSAKLVLFDTGEVNL